MNVSQIDATRTRKVEAERVHPDFPERWSPRAMSGAPVSQADLDVLFEAARWAPSCFNAQPWRFLYAHRDTPQWQPLFDTLVEGNQAWARHAGVLILVISRTRFEHNDKPNAFHAFDSGAAWMSLALQARHLGLVSHGMAGFDADAAREALHVPDLYGINCVIAVGHPGDKEALPEAYQERETPSPRKPLAEIAIEGGFSS